MAELEGNVKMEKRVQRSEFCVSRGDRAELTIESEVIRKPEQKSVGNKFGKKQGYRVLNHSLQDKTMETIVLHKRTEKIKLKVW